MREILFKAKRIDNGEWESGRIIHSERNISGEVHECFICRGFAEQADVVKIKVDPETVCQFTGLIDKNGARIFENDKLYVDYNCIGARIIDFNNGSYNCSNFNLKKCEVVGNIHD